MSFYHERERPVAAQRQPLYLLPDSAMPRQQINDPATAFYFFAEYCLEPTAAKNIPVKMEAVYPGFVPFPVNENHIVLASPDMYQEASHIESIHGAAHQARVAFLGKAMARIEGCNNRESDLVYIAGQLHDTQRVIDNNKDPDHGLRARRRLHERKFRERIDEYLIASSGRPATAEELQVIGVMCEFHEHDYQKIDPQIKEWFGKYLIPLMNADRLDRFRSPSTRWWPDPKFFLNQPGMEESTAGRLYEFAKYFSLGTEWYRLSMQTDVKHSTMVMANEVGLITCDQDKLRKGREGLIYQYAA